MPENVDFIIGAKNASQAAFREVAGDFDTLGSKLTAVTAVIGTVVAAVGAMALKFGEMADELDNTSTLLNVNVQTLREWEAVAIRSNLKGEDLRGMLEKLSRSAGEAAGGNKSLLESFNKIGISQDDLRGKLSNLEQLFPAVLEGIHSMGEGYRQVSEAQDLFGRGGVRIVGIVRDGKETFAEITETFREQAGVLSNEEVKAIADAHDAWESWINTIEQRGLTTFAQATIAIRDLWLGFAQADEVAKFEELRTDLAELQSQLFYAEHPEAVSNWTKVWNAIRGDTPESLAANDVNAIKAKIEAIKLEIQDADFLAGVAAAGEGAAPTGGGGFTGLAAIFGPQFSMEEFEQDVKDFAVQADIIKRINEEMAIQTSAQRGIEEDVAKRALEDEIGLANQRIDLAQSVADQINSINLRAQRQNTLSIVAGATANLAAATQGHKSLFAVSKAAAIANAVVATYQAATQALADVPYPYNYVVAAATIAAGLANVATISQTQFGGTAPSVSAAGPGGFTSTASGQPGAPAVASVAPSGQQQGTVTLVIETTDPLLDALFDGARARINNGDALLIDPNSRQAAEIRGG